MTTLVVVKANHGWPVDVTAVKDGAPFAPAKRVAPNMEESFYVHSGQDLLIHEVASNEILGATGAVGDRGPSGAVEPANKPSDDVYKAMPVAGYTDQTAAKVQLANEGKELEERYARWLDKLNGLAGGPDPFCDGRMVALARTNMQTGAMWAMRSIFQPGRIKLPGEA
jgi:hypothetical protein